MKQTLVALLGRTSDVNETPNQLLDGRMKDCPPLTVFKMAKIDDLAPLKALSEPHSNNLITLLRNLNENQN